MKSRKHLMIILLCVFGILVLSLIAYYVIREKSNKCDELEDSRILGELKSKEILYFNDIALNEFTCTGLTFDYHNNSFWVADYGALPGDKKPFPRLIEIQDDFSKVINILDLSDILDANANVQGICYDKIDDTLWVACGYSIVEISKKGEIVSSINLEKYGKFVSNGICIDGIGNIWCLCYTNYLLKYSHSGELVDTYSVNFDSQDHIYYYDGKIIMSVGADYNGNDNFIMLLDPNNLANYTLYRLENSYALEGICVKDGYLFSANDGYFHNAKINKSYICKYYLGDM